MLSIGIKLNLMWPNIIPICKHILVTMAAWLKRFNITVNYVTVMSWVFISNVTCFPFFEDWGWTREHQCLHCCSLKWKYIQLDCRLSPCAAKINFLVTFASFMTFPLGSASPLPCVHLWTLDLANIKGQAQCAAIICPKCRKKRGPRRVGVGWECFGTGVQFL